MDGYIKRREAVIAFGNYLGATSKRASVAVECILKPVPDADVRENVRGKWILFGDEKSAKAKCDQCGFEVCVTSEESDSFVAVKAITSQYIFCPNCGAYNGGEKNGLET